VRTYFDYVDPVALRSEYPIGEEFMDRFEHMSVDELDSLRQARFARAMELAWRTPFYRRVWSAHGIEAGDVRSLEQLSVLPVIDKSDLQASIEAFPPYGEMLLDSDNDGPVPSIMQTTSGTTGTPQPVLFGPRSREIQNVLLARSLFLQGLRDDDVVHSVYGFGMVNGGHYVREAISQYTRARLLSAGTGLETRSDEQIRIMVRFGATVLAGFGDYLRRLADLAVEQDVVIGRDLPLRMLSGAFSRDTKESLSKAWGGVPAYNWYGIADTGVIAAEGPETEGLVVWDDAQVVEIVSADPDHRPLPDGETGDLVVTCLFKDDLYPIIRFNTHDLSAVVGTACGELPFRRIAGFLGRSDNMVKVKGINVYPDSVGTVLAGDQAFTGEYVCIVHRHGDEVRSFEVLVEAAPGAVSTEEVGRRLRDRLGVTVGVTLVGPGETANMTELGLRQKPRRLVVRESSDNESASS
jgi:phenylacetate-CoA ligase